MYNNKYLLFTNGGGSLDPLNWSKDEAVLYSVNNLESIKPSSSQTIDIVFDTNNQYHTMSLTSNGTNVQSFVSDSNGEVTDVDQL